MRWELATDEQLKNIIKHDIDLPTHLLSGVVTEMLNRHLFDGLVKKVIMAHFHRIEIASKVLGIPEEDIFQFCKMKLFEAIPLFKQGKKPFIYFAFLKVRTDLKDYEGKVKAEKRKVYENIQSVDIPNERGESFINLFRSTTNVEMEVIRKISLEEKMKDLTPLEKTTFQLYMKGFSGSEIGVMLNIARIKAARRINSALSKMSGQKITVKDLGIINVGKGA